jgi:hypothetical protein
MNKIIIALIVLAAIAAGWFLLTANNTYDYVAEVDSEITELENELASLDAQVAAGSLTEEEATEAKIKIITRLNKIADASTQSEKAQLTPAQKEQLVAGLERLKVILVTYQDTLAAVETKAEDTQVQAKIQRRGSVHNTKPLVFIVADVITDVEETVSDSVQDYEASVELDAEVDAVIEEAESETTTETESDATVPEEETANTESDEQPTEDEMADEESTTPNEDTEDQSSTETEIDMEVSADAELETNN